eukprot:CAMPEP_0168484478 /NCGR_PEP_ID=MMETSP0228-20121227/66118_1 /TAXON_ID=133427 /ORGANISM="Protoceratium reticulatum, Strain CCCM 535 (=CCMP 1889)" /LENGTH=145 /DNA_ID=CAMNT_0008501019 /DNA_START=1 /DNA_END=438 /DNA_ORIENTATION=+
MAERFAHRLLLVLAWQTSEDGVDLVGGAICFVKEGRICGRYWGYPLDMPRIEFLHFECCYHALVEHAIERGYTCVEPGNGGGSIFKVQRDRGFEPVLTPSYHLVPDWELREEVRRLAGEAAAEVPSWTAKRHSAYAPCKRRGRER